MKNIIAEPIEKYLYDLLPQSEPAVLREMEAQAKQRDIPIVGPAVARLFIFAGADQRRQAHLRSRISHRIFHYLVGHGRRRRRTRDLHRRKS